MTDRSTATTDQHLVIRRLRVAPLGHPDQEILQDREAGNGLADAAVLVGARPGPDQEGHAEEDPEASVPPHSIILPTHPIDTPRIGRAGSVPVN